MKDLLTERHPYHNKYAVITLADCDLRKLLNEGFGIKGGEGTDDKIFLLSIDETEGYMAKIERSASYWW